jgi:hypothetical protein
MPALVRLLSAYLAEVIELQTFERSRASIYRQQESLTIQQRELAALAQKQLDFSAVASSTEEFCEQARAGLANASFEQIRFCHLRKVYQVSRVAKGESVDDPEPAMERANREEEHNVTTGSGNGETSV